jgi:hypothetical protein
MKGQLGGICSTHGEEIRNSYKILAGKSEWKRPLGGLRHRREDVIKMDLEEVMRRLDTTFRDSVRF